MQIIKKKTNSPNSPVAECNCDAFVLCLQLYHSNGRLTYRWFFQVTLRLRHGSRMKNQKLSEIV